MATKETKQSLLFLNIAISKHALYYRKMALGGLLTNFSTIRKSIKKMDSIDKMGEDGTLSTLSKRDYKFLELEEKLERNLGSISKMNRILLQYLL